MRPPPRPAQSSTTSHGVSSDDETPVGSTSTSAPVRNEIKGRNTPSTFTRAARQSKTNALAALRSVPGDPTTKAPGAVAAARMPAPDNLAPSSSRNAARRAVNRAPALDFSTLRTSAPRSDNPPPRPTGRPERLFGLKHAPIYHPTIEEFADPMAYIEMIGKEAQEFGICKIVPPVGWRPPFAIDTETFRFKTRLQELNSMEASARASLNFLEQLYIFHRQQGSMDRIAVPSVHGKPVDLWKLKRAVTDEGGYTEVTKERKWLTVTIAIGYTSDPVLAAEIKSAYSKIVVPFEDYVKRVKLAGGALPPDPTILHDGVPIDIAKLTTPKTSNGADSLATPRSDTGGMSEDEVLMHEKVRTASDKLNEALQTNRTKTSPTTSPELLPSGDVKPLDEAPGEACEICTFDHDPEKIVLCDGCDRGYHLNCLSPPLLNVPTSQFYCDTCLLMNGAEYGFEEGEEHSLYSFRARADAFKKQWLADNPMPSLLRGGDQSSAELDNVVAEQVAIEDHFEREFWKLVESQDQEVEVEYGADVNSTRQAGGFPNLEVHPNDPYSRDGWNLNNLPILAGSLLRYIKSDISGMTIPWIYVGMVFSTFAWHKEDHYTYSINFHSFGDTKTWYGVPGADDEKLEAAMKSAAPELFEQQPDLLFQLVTLMSPGRLQKHGVRVVVCDQRPNEFVITFPRAYHSGFNHGFNFNEAVNFALPNWLPTGLKCVNRYRDIKKNPVFSHDELLVTISQHEKSPRASQWLLPNWKEMVDREMALRTAVRALESPPMEEAIKSDLEEEQYQCGACRTLAYLSQVVLADDPTAIACLDHIDSLPAGPKLLRLRYPDQELKTMYARIKARSDKAGRAPADSSGNDIYDQRTTGRKRKPSAAALVAMGEEFPAVVTPPTPQPQAKKVKRETPESEIDDAGDIFVSNIDPSLSFEVFPPHTTSTSYLGIPSFLDPSLVDPLFTVTSASSSYAGKFAAPRSFNS